MTSLALVQSCPEETTIHSTRLPEGGNQAAAYRLEAEELLGRAPERFA